MIDRELIASSIRLRHAVGGRIDLPGWQIQNATRILAALAADGRAIVPKEPTEAMLTRGHADGVRASGLWERINPEMALELRMEYLPAAYRAMIAAGGDDDLR